MKILAKPSKFLGKFLALVAIVPSLTALPMNAETRCGWLVNPTPGNWWLTDRDATWMISAQGSSNRAKNMEMIPDISAKQYVKVNGNYGYGCACMDVATNFKRKRITAIKSFEQLNLEVCRNDKSLSKP